MSIIVFLCDGDPQTAFNPTFLFSSHIQKNLRADIQLVRGDDLEVSEVFACTFYNCTREREKKN